jgi:putative tricarboxylic transport membrane protein
VLFGLGNLRKQTVSRLAKTSSLWLTREDWRRCTGPWLRGTGVGFLIGALPGAGATIASFLSYGIEKKVSRHPEEFGKGAIEGMAGPEAANNAAAGSATAAIMLAALQGYGINTGPLLLQKQPELVWGLIASLYIGNVMLLVLNLPLVGFWVKLLKIPEALLYPIILAFSILGVYSLNLNVFDLYMMNWYFRLYAAPV